MSSVVIRYINHRHPWSDVGLRKVKHAYDPSTSSLQFDGAA